MAPRLLTAGRLVLWFMCLSMPLVFCKETMYIFQAKTFVLQLGGMALLALMVGHQILTKAKEPIFSHPIAWLMLVFVSWQIYKSFDSIAPVISQRNMSRLFWLPILVWSFTYFVKSRAQFERTIDVMIAAAVLAYIYAGLIYYEPSHAFLFGTTHQTLPTLFELDGWPFGPFLRWFFYPDGLVELLKDKEGPTFVVTAKSFFAGKQDAGSFGNKNFLAAYINLSSGLLIYRSITLWKKSGRKRMLACVLILAATWSFSHLMPLENRGSWLGFLAGAFAVGLYMSFKSLSSKQLGLALGLLSLSLLLLSISFYLLSPERFASIFSTSQGSNELRRHTWVNYIQAWSHDKDWPGFESDAKRWLTGFGNYSFRVLYPKVRTERIFQLENNQHNSETTHPHNEYIGLLGELGLLGLGLYLAIVIWLLLQLWNKKCKGHEDRILVASLIFAMVTILVHQFVTVGVRYTGLAFQVWMLFALVLWREDKTTSSRQSLKLMAAPVLILLAWLALPNLTLPLQLMRSQHAYEMGQIYFTTLGDYHAKLKAHQSELQVALQKIKTAEAQGDAIPPNFRERVAHGQEVFKRQIEIFEKAFHSANRFFEAGFELDHANFESIYIGSNLNVQFANQDLAGGQLERSRQRFEKALNGYAKVELEMPYFVQLRYWQGVCWKGLATLEIKKLDHQNLTPDQKQVILNQAESYFSKAIGYYDLYEQQDPTFKDLFLDRYFCYRYIGEEQKALQQLVYFLQGLERSGLPLFNPERRYDARSLMNHILKLKEGEDWNRALAIYRNLLRYYNSSLLLPFVPKTERHIVNSFRLLNI